MGICRGKTDKIDAGRIAMYAFRFTDRVRIYQPCEEVLAKLKDLQAYRSRLIKIKTGLEVSSKELIKVKDDSISLFIRDDSLTLIEDLVLKIKQIDRKTKELIKSSLLVMQNYESLLSIKGVGTQNAVGILVLTGNFHLFTDPRKFACYCGVVPFPHRSGSSIRGTDRVSNLSNRKMKALLTQAARSASMHNPYYREYYKRKIQQGKNDRLIINNIKNKLIHLIFALVRNKQTYNPNYVHRMNQSA